MPKTPIRVLVVDDCEPFRQLLSEILKDHAEFHVVSTVSDGLKAIEQAGELQPDLVILDIGLPRLNGIEVARRIRVVSSRSKILFLSQESSARIMEAALAAGGTGYVVKADAGSELLTAVNALVRGETFVGRRFADRNPTVAPRVRRHTAHFYPDDAHFLDGCARCIATALEAGKAAMFLGTEPHREGVVIRLQARGLDMSAVIEEGRYIALDAAETLATFMVDGQPDRHRFLKIAGGLISAAAKTGTGDSAPVMACGECAPLLWEQGETDAAIRLEQLWSEIGRTYDIDIQCGFVLTAFQRNEQAGVFDSVCAEHSSVLDICRSSE